MPASPVSTQMMGKFVPRLQELTTPDPIGGWAPPENWQPPDPHSSVNYQSYQKGTTAWRSPSHLPHSKQTFGSYFNFGS
jgi:hypothetical protein